MLRFFFHLDGFHVSKALFVFFFKKLLPSWQKAWKSFKVKTLVHSSPLMSDNIDPSNHCLVFLWERLFQDVDSFHQTSKWSPLRLSTHIQHTSSFDLGVHILDFRNIFNTLSIVKMKTKLSKKYLIMQGRFISIYLHAVSAKINERNDFTLGNFSNEQCIPWDLYTY